MKPDSPIPNQPSLEGWWVFYKPMTAVWQSSGVGVWVTAGWDSGVGANVPPL